LGRGWEVHCNRGLVCFQASEVRLNECHALHPQELSKTANCIGRHAGRGREGEGSTLLKARTCGVLCTPTQNTTALRAASGGNINISQNFQKFPKISKRCHIFRKISYNMDRSLKGRSAGRSQPHRPAASAWAPVVSFRISPESVSPVLPPPEPSRTRRRNSKGRAPPNHVRQTPEASLGSGCCPEGEEGSGSLPHESWRWEVHRGIRASLYLREGGGLVVGHPRDGGPEQGASRTHSGTPHGHTVQCATL